VDRQRAVGRYRLRLQEIVKNFVSGLILLTERPVKVGDMVSLAGVEGDIRRINVRATEIQLGDRSTVIVPNSQLISQNLRNVTMHNNTQGVATLQLTFPLNTDPEAVRDLLLDVYRENEAILDIPAPSVTFSQLAPNGITLSVTGYVNSPRIAAAPRATCCSRSSSGCARPRFRCRRRKRCAWKTWRRLGHDVSAPGSRRDASSSPHHRPGWTARSSAGSAGMCRQRPAARVRYGIARADQARVWRNITGTTQQALAEFARNHGALQILVRSLQQPCPRRRHCATQQNPV
jgi:hypothetical protein